MQETATSQEQSMNMDVRLKVALSTPGRRGRDLRGGTMLFHLNTANYNPTGLVLQCLCMNRSSQSLLFLLRVAAAKSPNLVHFPPWVSLFQLLPPPFQPVYEF